MNKLSCVLFIIVGSFYGCEYIAQNSGKEKKRDSDPYKLSENFTEEEYLNKVKAIKGEKYYYFSYEDLHKWHILMRKIEGDSLFEGDIVALFDADSNIVNQVLISKMSKEYIKIDYNDTIFTFAGLLSLERFLNAEAKSFGFYRKKTGRGSHEVWH